MTPPCRLCLKLKATQCHPRPGFKLIPASCIILSPTWKLPLSIILSSSSHRCFPPFLPWKLGFRPKKERDTTRAHTRALQGGTRPLWTDAYALSSHVCHYHANIRHQHEAWADDDVWCQSCKSETRLHYDDLTRRAIQEHLTCIQVHLTVWGDIIWLRKYEILEYVTLTVSWLLSEWSSSSMIQSISSSLLVATKLQIIQNISSHPQPIPDIHQEQAAPRQRQTHQQEESSFRIPIQTWPSSYRTQGRGTTTQQPCHCLWQKQTQLVDVRTVCVHTCGEVSPRHTLSSCAQTNWRAYLHSPWREGGTRVGAPLSRAPRDP